MAINAPVNNERIGSINFDAETKLQVEQRGGGGAGVGGENGLAAVNLVTGESTNEVIDALREETQEQAAEVDRLETANAELTNKLSGYKLSYLTINIKNSSANSIKIYFPSADPENYSGNVSMIEMNSGAQDYIRLDIMAGEAGAEFFWRLLLEGAQNVRYQSLPEGISIYYDYGYLSIKFYPAPFIDPEINIEIY